MKKFLFLALAALSLQPVVFSQNVAINADGSLPDANAMLDIKASTKGILIPRTSSASRSAIANTKGLLVYDTTTSSFWYNDGAAWQQISNGATLNGTVNYLPKFTGTSAVGNSELVDNGQYVGIGTTNPTAGLNIIHNGGIIAKGDTLSANNYTLSETGAGAKFIWYPKKAALRSGFLDAGYGFEWNDEYLGNWSTAFGYDEFATGTGSFAAGYQTSSRGSYSFSAGNNTQATRIGSVAMGSRAKAEGDYSFAAGNGTTAVGVSSFALGNGNATQGDYSFALGNNTYSGGNNSLAAGNNTQASGVSAIAMGDGSHADGFAATSLGNLSNASGYASVALGDKSTASANYAVAIGNQNTADGQSALALGDNTHANGFACTSLGFLTTASSFYATAMGTSTTASGAGSVAMGYSTTAAGKYSFVWGVNSNATGPSSMVLGANLFDGGHKGNAMLGDTDPWNAGSVGSGTDDQMICRFNNGYYFLTGGNTNRTGMVANHGDNSWSQISDSTKKEKIIPVNGEEILNRIAKFKLGTWNYKGQDVKTFRHYGPMAQDFHNAFGHDALGTIGNDTLINQADFLGVSFTAIQALEKRTEKIDLQQKQLLDLQKQNNLLAATNEKLQQQMQQMMATLNALNKTIETLASVKTNAGVSGQAIASTIHP